MCVCVCVCAHVCAHVCVHECVCVCVPGHTSGAELEWCGVRSGGILTCKNMQKTCKQIIECAQFKQVTHLDSKRLYRHPTKYKFAADRPRTRAESIRSAMSLMKIPLKLLLYITNQSKQETICVYSAELASSERFAPVSDGAAGSRAEKRTT